MPLTKQIMTVPLSQGIDTKTDAKQLPYGKLLELENGVFTSPKLLQKRYGYTALPRTVDSSSGYVSLSSGMALTSYRKELVAIGRDTQSPSKSRFYSYAEGAASWVMKSDYTPCDIKSQTASRGSNIKTGCDSAFIDSGFEVCAWEESGGVYYSAIDTESQQIISTGLVSSNACSPRVVPFIGGIVIYYINTSLSQIFARPILLSLNASLGAAVAITSATPGTDGALSNTTAYRSYDIVQASNEIFLAFLTDTGKVNVRIYGPGAPYAPSAQEIFTPPAQPRRVSLCFNATDFEIAALVDCDAGGSVFSVYGYTTDGGLSVPFPAPFTVLSGASGSVFRSIGCVSVPEETATRRYSVWATELLSTNRYVTRIVHTNFSAIDDSGVIRGVGLAARPWSYGGRSFAAVAFVSNTTGSPSGLQNQYLVVSDNVSYTDIVARYFYTTASGVATTAGGGPVVLPSCYFVDESTVKISTLQSAVLLAAAGDLQVTSGVNIVSVSFGDAPLVDNRSEIGGTLVLGGGLPSIYDGSSVTESGFLVWPDEVSGTLSAGGGLAAGTYQWVVCYEWTDNLGVIHRSAPSLPVTLVAASGDRVSLTVSTLTLTKKQTQSPVRIVVYRTLVNGTVFFRTSSLTAPTVNDVTVFTATISDSLPDVDLAARPYLYSTGGVVENIPPGALRSLVIHRGRLWGIDSVNRNRLWYSKQISADSPVEFSEFFYFDVDERAGEITALASLDDKLIVFKKTQIMMISGQGPDSTGNQSDFSDSIFVTADCGCVDSRSIVVVPSGLMFQSAKGIYFLDRSLQALYIGAAVEAYNSYEIVSSQLIPTANQVRFVSSAGVALVYDYYVGQWSVFTNHNAKDTVVWSDRFCWLKADGTVMKEDPSRHDDNGSFVGLKFKTGWITFATDAGSYILLNADRDPTAMNSYQRVRRLMLLGEYRSPHRLRVEVSYDYQDTPSQTTTIVPPGDEIYGEPGEEYGNESPYGGTWQLYQWRVDCARQKCQAVQVTVSDQQIGNQVGDCVRFSALSAEVGLKPGTTRVPMTHVKG